MSHEAKHMKEALRIRSARLAQTERALQEWEIMVASREVQVGIREDFLQRRETDLRKREESLRTREVQLQSIECKLEPISKQADELDLWSKVATGKHKPLLVYIRWTHNSMYDTLDIRDHLM